MEGETLTRAVGDLLAKGQIQRLDVVAVLGKGGQCGIANLLASAETQFAEKASASPSQVFHDGGLDVDLEIEKVDPLPIGPIQSQDIPGLGHLSASAKGNHVQVRKDPQQQLLGQLPIDQRLVILTEHPDLPVSVTATAVPVCIGRGGRPVPVRHVVQVVVVRGVVIV